MSKISLNTSFTGLTKLRDWWSVVKSNFIAIATGHNTLEDRVDNIVAGAGSSNTEIVDARHSAAKSKDFIVLTDRLEEIETDASSHMAETMQYESKKYQVVNPYKNGGSLSLKGQIHCHTTGSDGADTPTALVTAYKNAGYDFISITDHNVLTVDPGVAGIIFIPGVEETNSRHITAYDVAEQTSQTDIQTIINFHRNRGKLCSIAHPTLADTLVTEVEMAGYNNYNFVEVYNATGAVDGQKHWDIALSTGKKTFGIAVDDCHNIAGSTFNKAWVVAHVPSADKASILQSLREGNFYASTGNDISISLVDNVITATSTEPSNFAFYGDNGRVLYTANGVTTANYAIKGDEMYVRVKSVKVSDATSAWSNPIFIDSIGGDGRVASITNKFLAELEKESNRNILHNWDFSNPVNQRGLTSYSGVGYAIDRWKLNSVNAAIDIQSGNVKFTVTGGYDLRQVIDNFEQYKGLTLTFSVELASPTVNSVAIGIYDGVSQTVYTLDGKPAGIRKVTRTIDANATELYVRIFGNSQQANSVEISRVKLELGTIPTLDKDFPADYLEQLALCQRYYVPINASTVYIGTTTSTGTATHFFIPLPAVMRSTPIVIDEGKGTRWQVRTHVSVLGISAAATVMKMHPNGAMLQVLHATHTASIPAAVFRVADGCALSAEL